MASTLSDWAAWATSPVLVIAFFSIVSPSGPAASSARRTWTAEFTSAEL